MNKLNILLCVYSLAPGGTEKHVYTLAKHLPKDLFRVHLLTFEDKIMGFGDIPSDVDYHCFSNKSRSELIRLTRKYIVENDIQIVHSCCFDTGIILSAATFFSKVKFVLGHRGLHKTYTKKKKIVNFLMNCFANALIFNSKAGFNLIPSFLRYKSVVFYNGFDSKMIGDESRDELRRDLNIGAEELIVGCLGRVNKVKGQDVLIEAFANARHLSSDMKLLIIGDGKGLENFKNLASEKNIQKKVNFTGSIPNAGKYIRAMDVFVLPSRLESFPNVLIEALYLNKIVIASKVGGVPEIINDDNGYLFKPGDVASLTERLSKVIENFEEEDKKAKSREIKVEEKYCVKNYLRNHTELFYRIVGIPLYLN